MSLRTVFVGACFGSGLEGEGPPESLIDYAAGLAASQEAHLSVALGVLDIVVRSAFTAGLQQLVESFNREQREKAQSFADQLTSRLNASGVVSDIEVALGPYASVAPRFVQLARLADVAILEPNNQAFSLREGLLEEVLCESGRPVILVPKNWSRRAGARRILVAWDGGAKSARAIGDALSLLEAAQEVEIVSVSGDVNPTKRLDGAEIAPHLARHCRSVTVTPLSSSEGGDIPASLAAHARLTGADLMVMGAYGRAKISELLLGGVTRSMILEPPIPVFMSY
ncbi:universal stress protein [Methylocystis bryophila]|uniref:universal stress protein n=1 Tax=Methylocystis bryophila TaxID=655015 RepID=UPI001319D557|nr:universal stress protein [Methylocystis bryophila]